MQKAFGHNSVPILCPPTPNPILTFPEKKMFTLSQSLLTLLGLVHSWEEEEPSAHEIFRGSMAMLHPESRTKYLRQSDVRQENS